MVGKVLSRPFSQTMIVRRLSVFKAVGQNKHFDRSPTLLPKVTSVAVRVGRQFGVCEGGQGRKQIPTHERFIAGRRCGDVSWPDRDTEDAVSTFKEHGLWAASRWKNKKGGSIARTAFSIFLLILASDSWSSVTRCSSGEAC